MPLTRDCQRFTENLQKILKRKYKLLMTGTNPTDDQMKKYEEFRQTLQKNPMKKKSVTTNDLIAETQQNEDHAMFSEDEDEGEIRASRSEMRSSIKVNTGMQSRRLGNHQKD